MAKTWLAGALCTVAFGGTVVLPPPQASSPGNAADLATGASGTGIVQFLYAPLFGTGPVDITALSFRSAVGTGPVDITFGALNVSLSTSPNYPNMIGPGTAISSTFANNVGPDVKQVFSGSNVTLSDAGCSGPGACPFDLNIVFSTPFYFNPAAGALLVELDFTNLVDISGSFDAESYNSPGLFVAQVLEIGSGSATSGTLKYQGNIAQFTVTPVPEPASWMMMAGALLWTYLRLRKNS